MTTMSNLRFCLTSLVVALVSVTHGFLMPNNWQRTQQQRQKVVVPDKAVLFASRRDLFVSTAFAFLLTVQDPKSAAFAAETPPTKAELERVKIGYKQIQYLLNNFETETTQCRDNGGECKRNAEPIRKVLGLRSTTDPLFQIEKVFAKAKYMDIDPDRLEEFYDATEEWDSSIAMSNSMAFISQFGEYNPGGGKDSVLKYLEESKKQVIAAEKSLKTIMDCLGLE